QVASLLAAPWGRCGTMPGSSSRDKEHRDATDVEAKSDRATGRGRPRAIVRACAWVHRRRHYHSRQRGAARTETRQLDWKRSRGLCLTGRGRRFHPPRARRMARLTLSGRVYLDTNIFIYALEGYSTFR